MIYFGSDAELQRKLALFVEMEGERRVFSVFFL